MHQCICRLSVQQYNIEKCKCSIAADQLLNCSLYELTECKIIIFASIVDHFKQLWNDFCVSL